MVGTNTFLPWANEEEDPRFQPLSELLTEAYSRYRRPIAITETSHSGEDRGIWIKHIAGECSVLIENGLPLWGICIYPIIDRPDWDNLQYWHHSGLWDAEFSEDGSQKRVLNIGYADSLLEAQLIIKQAMDKPMPGFLLPENRYFSA